MGGNGVQAFDNGYMSGYMGSGWAYNEYMRNLTGLYTRSLNYCPGNIWNARIATQMWNASTHDLAFPYGQYYNFTGQPRYVVASCYEMPVTSALAMHGYSMTPTYNDLVALRESTFVQGQLSSKPDTLKARIKTMKSIGEWNDSKYLHECEGVLTAEEAQKLKDEAKELAEKLEKLDKKLEIVMKNEAGLDPSSVLDSINELEKEADSLDVSVRDLYKRCTEAAKKVQEQEAKDAKAKQDEEAKAAAKKPETEKPEAEKPEAEKPEEEEKPEYTPPTPKTSPEKTKIIEKGTKVKVKAKGGTDALTGKYYEYEGKIYKVTDSADKPEDVTDKVEKMT